MGEDATDKMNCSELLVTRYLPTPQEAFGVLGSMGTVMIAVGGVTVAIVLFLFVQEAVILARFWPPKTYLLTGACLCIFPVTCFCLYLNILIPRSSYYTNSIIQLLLPVPLIVFYELVISYGDGEDKLIQTLSGESMTLRGPPLCCVCWCFPKPPLTRRRFYVMKYSIYQLLIFHLVVFIISQVTDYLGYYRMGELSTESASPYLLFLNALSFFLGVYGIVVFTRLCSTQLLGLRLRSKFVVLQLNFLFVRTHFFAFDFSGRMDMMPCQPPLSSLATSIYLKSALLLSESFVLAILARVIFSRAPPIPAEDTLAAVTPSSERRSNQ